MIDDSDDDSGDDDYDTDVDNKVFVSCVICTCALLQYIYIYIYDHHFSLLFFYRSLSLIFVQSLRNN